MYAVWAKESLTQASVQAPSQCELTKSARDRNGYVLLLSALCTCTQAVTGFVLWVQYCISHTALTATLYL